MADNYSLFSEIITDIPKEGVAWRGPRRSSPSTRSRSLRAPARTVALDVMARAGDRQGVLALKRLSGPLWRRANVEEYPCHIPMKGYSSRWAICGGGVSLSGELFADDELRNHVKRRLCQRYRRKDSP